METHAHDLHKAPGHGWTHYFFEFFMLFLAVFCGFLAENLRENSIERHREKEYVTSLLKDLEFDTAQFNLHSTMVNKKMPFFDSVFRFLDDPAAFNYKHSAGTFMNVYTEIFYKPVEPTIQQLKNSGNLRLIENKKVLDSILAYDSWITGPFYDQNDAVFQFQSRVLQFSEKMYDYHNFNQLINYNSAFNMNADSTHYLTLISKDKALVLELYNITVGFKITNAYLNPALVTSKASATNLMAFIKKEYHLE
jgi:hypothetical protein